MCHEKHRATTRNSFRVWVPLKCGQIRYTQLGINYVAHVSFGTVRLSAPLRALARHKHYFFFYLFFHSHPILGLSLQGGLLCIFYFLYRYLYFFFFLSRNELRNVFHARLGTCAYGSVPYTCLLSHLRVVYLFSVIRPRFAFFLFLLSLFIFSSCALCFRYLDSGPLLYASACRDLVSGTPAPVKYLFAYMWYTGLARARYMRLSFAGAEVRNGLFSRKLLDVYARSAAAQTGGKLL